MRKIRFSIYFCGMSDDTFSAQIMIYKPQASISRDFDESLLQQLKITSINDLIVYMKTLPEVAEDIGFTGFDQFNIDAVYIQHCSYLLGFQDDKKIEDIFRDFPENQLNFAFFIVGGASIHNETGYRFIIHPNEKIHEHMPHVHVAKAEVEIRYSLETLLPLDPLVNPHKRDNKKIITPFLSRNHKLLLEMWSYYMKGYTTPEIAQTGQQFYKES
jgi:hypothetical protein